MSYTIRLRINQTGADWFGIVEKTAQVDGFWTEVNGENILTMNGSGTSGTLRFKNAADDYVLVALGVHNYRRWCDILTDITHKDTGVQINPTYYQDASVPGSRSPMLWKQLDKIEKTDSKGKKFAVNYIKADGNELIATITIST